MNQLIMYMTIVHTELIEMMVAKDVYMIPYNESLQGFQR